MRATSQGRAEALTLAERSLYHQIHPAKLATDIGTTPFALYLAWQRKPVPALIVSFVPSIVSSAVTMRFADLRRYKYSSAGDYLRHYMTPAMQALRLAGFGFMMLSAWFHRVWLMPAGLLLVLYAWANGLIRKLKFVANYA